MVTMKNYLREDEELSRNYDYAEAGGKPYIIIRTDGRTEKWLIDKNAEYYNDLKRDVERSGNSFNKLRDEFIKRKEAQKATSDSKTEPPKPETPKSSSQQPPKPKPQFADIRGGDGKTKYGDGTPIETKKELEPPRQDPPKEKPQSEPPRQDPPKPRQTPQQKAGLPARVPTKFVSRVAQYQKDRASAVKSGDPVEMQKVRTSGMEIWKKANPKLADAAAEKARIRGTAQTDNPLIDKQMRSRMPLNSPSVQSPRVAKLGSGNQSLVNNPNVFKAAKRPATAATSAKPVATSDKPVATSAKPVATSAKPVAKNGPTPLKVEPFKVVKESYDVVLEYLLDGHADTINEANYIMLEMDSQTIQYIVNQS